MVTIHISWTMLFNFSWNCWMREKVLNRAFVNFWSLQDLLKLNTFHLRFEAPKRMLSVWLQIYTSGFRETFSINFKINRLLLFFQHLALLFLWAEFNLMCCPRWLSFTFTATRVCLWICDGVKELDVENGIPHIIQSLPTLHLYILWLWCN